MAFQPMIPNVAAPYQAMAQGVDRLSQIASHFVQQWDAAQKEKSFLDNLHRSVDETLTNPDNVVRLGGEEAVAPIREQFKPMKGEDAKAYWQRVQSFFSNLYQYNAVGGDRIGFKPSARELMLPPDQFKGIVETHRGQAIGRASQVASTGLEPTGQPSVLGPDGNEETGDIVRYEQPPKTQQEFQSRVTPMLPPGTDTKAMEANPAFQQGMKEAQGRERQSVGEVIGQEGQLQSGAAASVLGMGMDTKPYEQSISRLPKEPPKPADPLDAEIKDLNRKLKEADLENKRLQGNRLRKDAQGPGAAYKDPLEPAIRMESQAVAARDRATERVKALKAAAHRMSKAGDNEEILAKLRGELQEAGYDGPMDSKSLEDALVQANRSLVEADYAVTFAKQVTKEAMQRSRSDFGQSARAAESKMPELQAKEVADYIVSSGLKLSYPENISQEAEVRRVFRGKGYSDEVIARGIRIAKGQEAAPKPSASGYAGGSTMTDQQIEQALMSNPKYAQAYQTASEEQKRQAIEYIKSQGWLP